MDGGDVQVVEHGPALLIVPFFAIANKGLHQVQVLPLQAQVQAIHQIEHHHHNHCNPDQQIALAGEVKGRDGRGQRSQPDLGVGPGAGHAVYILLPKRNVMAVVLREDLVHTLVVLGLKLEVALRVVADGANVRSLRADDNMSAVRALPNGISVA